MAKPSEEVRQPVLLFDYATHRFECLDAYSIYRQLKAAGFRYDPRDKVWFTRSTWVAATASRYATESTLELLRRK